MKVEPKFFLGAVPFALGILAPGASVFASQSAALTSYSVSQQVNKVSGVYNPQIEMFARFKMKSSFHKTKRII